MEPIYITWDEKLNNDWKSIALNVAMPIIAVLILAYVVRRPPNDYKLIPLIISGFVAFVVIKWNTKYHIKHVFSGNALGFRYEVSDMTKSKETELREVDTLKYGLLLQSMNCYVEVPSREISTFEMVERTQCLQVNCQNGKVVTIRVKGLRSYDVEKMIAYFKEITG